MELLYKIRTLHTRSSLKSYPGLWSISVQVDTKRNQQLIPSMTVNNYQVSGTLFEMLTSLPSKGDEINRIKGNTANIHPTA